MRKSNGGIGWIVLGMLLVVSPVAGRPTRDRPQGPGALPESVREEVDRLVDALGGEEPGARAEAREGLVEGLTDPAIIAYLRDRLEAVPEETAGTLRDLLGPYGRIEECWSIGLGRLGMADYTSVVFDGRVYCLDMCIDADRGVRLWGDEGGIGSPPIVAGDRVIRLRRHHGGIFCKDAGSGDDRWHVDPGWGRPQEGALAGDVLVVAWETEDPLGGTLRSMTLDDGSTRWETSSEYTATGIHAGEAALVVVEARYDTEEIPNQWRGVPGGQEGERRPMVRKIPHARLRRIDPASGETLWATDPWPAGTVVEALLSDPGLFAVARRRSGEGPGEAELHRIDPATGDRLWSASLGEGRGATLVEIDGRLLACVAASLRWIDPATGETRRTAPLPGDGNHRIAVSDGKLFLTTVGNWNHPSRIARLDPASGDPVWIHDLPGGIGGLAAWEEHVVVGIYGGTLVCLRDLGGSEGGSSTTTPLGRVGGENVE